MAAATIVNAASSFRKNVRPLPIVSCTKRTSDKYFNSLSLDHQVQRKYGKAINALKEEANNMIISNGASISIPKNVRPPTVIHTESTWGEYFNSFSLDHQAHEKNGDAIEALKEEVKSMLIMMANNYSSGNTKTRGMLVLIDTLERLGIAHHFDQEIEELLGQVFNKSQDENIEDDDDDDLFITSLQFRLLRQHHYHVSCGVFDKFVGKNKKFKESLSDNVMGLLSLYEATHLRIHGEPIMDEAAAFSVNHLKRMVQQLESTSPLQDYLKRALEKPLHRSGPRLHIHHFISLYEKDDSKNELLIKLAKLDFNYVQNVYRQELCEVSRWWSELKIQSEFGYVRDRVVESYLWATLSIPKPQSSYARITLAKITQVSTIIDDTYDNYATLEEANLLTKMVQRWNINEIDQLPDYMKNVYMLILREYDDFERNAAEQGKLFSAPYAKEITKQVFEAENKGMKWVWGQEEMPSFDDYIQNSMGTSCPFLYCSRTIPGFQYVTEETIDWLRSEPNIFKASVKVGRLLDDLSGFERESKEGVKLTGVDFYMKQHGLSFQETKDKFIELTEDAWKDLNTEWMVINSQVTKDMAEQALCAARAAEVFCRSCEDGYTKSDVMAPHVTTLFVDPIIL